MNGAVEDQLDAAEAEHVRRLFAKLQRARREFEVSGDYVDRSSNDFTLKFLGSRTNYAVARPVSRATSWRPSSSPRALPSSA